VSESTFTLNKVPALPLPAIQLTLVFIQLVTGLSLGYLLGTVVGFQAWSVVAGAAAGLALGIVTARKLGGASIPVSVIVDATHLRLLYGKQGKNAVAVPLEDVRSIEERGKPDSGMVIIGTRRRSFALPRVAFDTGVPERIHDAVCTALALRPQGTALVEAMQRREQLGREFMRRRPKVVWAFAGCIIIAYLIEQGTNAFNNAGMLLSLGGNAPVLVADGQWWRLFSANFLHVSLLHFYLNYLALTLVGVLLERLVGALRMLAISLVAGISGTVVSALVSAQVFAVGASPMLFGMIGALFVVNLRSGDALPAGFRLSWIRWAVVLGLNGAISFLPMVDGLAHLGGLIGGITAALLLVPKDLNDRHTYVWAAAIGGCLSVVYLTAFGMAMANSAKGDARADLLHATFDHPRLRPVLLNNLAWTFAIKPTTRPDELAAVERGTRRIVDENPQNTSFRDTYAYVLDRQGRHAEAAEQERISLVGPETKASSGHRYTMLLRYLVERAAANADATTIQSEGDELVIESDVPGAAIFAGDSYIGLVRIVLPADARTARVPIPSGLDPEAIRVLLVDGAGPETRTSLPQVTFAPRNTASSALPR
jgi:rhomboid protease GluP